MAARVFCLVAACLYGVQFGSTLYFQPEWLHHIISLIRDHEKLAFLPVVISSVRHQYAAEGSGNVSALLFLPKVIIWDPILQFPRIFNDLQSQMSCDECGKEVKFVTWQDGSVERYYPRCIYGMYGAVILVCKIYRCPNGHLMTSCDPYFLDYFSDRQLIPFFLLHKSGITCELQSFIFHLSSQGKSFADIENILLSTIQTHRIRRILMYKQLCTCTDIVPSFPNTYVSKDFVINAFLVTYNELKSYFFSEMYKIQAEYISCDHTFRFASHIGVYLTGKWIPQYDALFIMQNEIGQVLFWKLTMGTAYASVCDGIELLK